MKERGQPINGKVVLERFFPRKRDNTGKKETEGKTKAMFTPQRCNI